jgi:hypothetical protein
VIPLFFSEGTFAYRPAAYAGWVFVKGTGILDKRSFLPTPAPASAGSAGNGSGSAAPARRGSGSGSGINVVDVVSLVVVAIVLVLAGAALRASRAAGRR